MPTKLKAEHLPAFAREFDMALREGVISIVEAREFCTAVYTMVLEQQVRAGQARAITPEGNRHGEHKTRRTDHGA